MTGRTNEYNEKLKNDRLGQEKTNNQECLMRVVEYNNAADITVEFQDKNKTKVKTTWGSYLMGSVLNPNLPHPSFKNRLGDNGLSNQGCPMLIVEYNGANDIVVEFQDEFCGKVHTVYSNFKRGNVKNPFHKSVYGVGMIGDKYPAKIGGKHTKEYKAWRTMIVRAYSDKYSREHQTYEDVSVCEEWYLFTNFYDWLHAQPNFDKWYAGEQWNVDKDILRKGNKIYSPEFCCLVPHNVNKLFTNHKNARGSYPIGVTFDKKLGKYIASCNNPFLATKTKSEYIGRFKTAEDAFYAYKKRKEEIISLVAKDEYAKGNITKECYDAMMKYEVEITD